MNSGRITLCGFLITVLACISSLNAQSLIINEVMAKNANTIFDENGEADDWIEIYNAGIQPVNLANYYLTDDLNNPAQWRVPATNLTATNLAPGAMLVIWLDGQPEQGILHANFKLAATGERVALFQPDGISLVDSVSFGPLDVDESSGRYPDAGPTRKRFSVDPAVGITASPGMSNLPLRINEIMAKNDGYVLDEKGLAGDWIEIFNFGSAGIDLDGMFLSDSYSQQTQYALPDITVPGKGYVLIWCDGTVLDAVTNPDTAHANFKLSASGEKAGLFLNANTAVDTVAFGPQKGNFSYGRYPDGARSFSFFEEPTPWLENKQVEGATISNVTRAPSFPDKNDDVRILATIVSPNTGLKAEVVYETAFGATGRVVLLDNGAQGDGLAGDGEFGGKIPAQQAGAVVDWYIVATDDGGTSSFFPAVAPLVKERYRVTDWAPESTKELSFSEPSGLVFNRNTGTLFSHNDNQKSKIYELSTEGATLNVLEVNGNDIEGIAFNATFDTLFTVEEAASKIVKYTLAGNKIGEINVAAALENGNGLEGITIDPQSGTIFLLHEKDPVELIELHPSGTILRRKKLDFATDVSGIGMHPSRGTLFIVSDESMSLTEITRKGIVLNAWYLPFVKGEGITFGADASTVYIVSEQGNNLHTFKLAIPQRGSDIYINEIMARNNSTKQDENLEFDDWIEIYNGQQQPVDLAGFYITNDFDNPTKWQIPYNNSGETTLSADDVLLLWADDQVEQGSRHLNFKLSALGDQVGLYQIAGGGYTLVDSVNFGVQKADTSFGRERDGSEPWILFAKPTPGELNRPTSVGTSEANPPGEFSLLQNYPNPFNPVTMIAFNLPAKSKVRLSVHNLLGQEVAVIVNKKLAAGEHSFRWDASMFATGLYYYKVEAGVHSQVRKMLLLR